MSDPHVRIGGMPGFVGPSVVRVGTGDPVAVPGVLSAGRVVRVYDDGGGGGVDWLASALWEGWWYIAPYPINGGADPDQPFPAGWMSQVALGWDSTYGFSGQSAASCYVSGPGGPVSVLFTYSVAARNPNGWGTVIPWELRATAGQHDTPSFTDDGFDGPVLASGTLDITGQFGYVSSGPLTVVIDVPASGEVAFGIAVPGFDSVVEADGTPHGSSFEDVGFGISAAVTIARPSSLRADTEVVD